MPILPPKCDGNAGLAHLIAMLHGKGNEVIDTNFLHFQIKSWKFTFQVGKDSHFKWEKITLKGPGRLYSAGQHNIKFYL
jgi:hypothetical protein